LTVDICGGFDGLCELEVEWTSLLDRLSRVHFNQHPAWYRSYFEAIRPEADRVQFLALRRQGRLIGVVPISLQPSRLGVRAVSLANDRALYTTDLVIAEDEDQASILMEFAAACRRRSGLAWDVFRVSYDGVLENSGAYQLFSNGSLASRRIEQQRSCMVIDVDDHPQVLARLKSKFRNTLKRSHRRLIELGEPEYLWASSPEETDSAFNAFVALEMASWKGNEAEAKAEYPGPAAIGLQDWKKDFYRRVMQHFSELGAVDLLSLRVDGRLIGSQVNVSLKQTTYLLKTSMDASVSGIATGHLMIDALIKRINASRQTQEINLLTDYDWHRSWVPRTLGYYHFSTYNRTALGRLSALRARLAG
jgi:CelD/BcsL family acetyltransferase involved in cellulose biosynthesis